MDQDTDKLIKNGNDNTASLYSKISDIHTQMQSFNTSAFADFRGDIANLSARMDKQLQILSGDIKNYNTDVKNKFDSVNANVSGKFDEVNSNVSGKFDEVNSNVTGKLDDVNASVTGKLDDVNSSVSGKLNEVNNSVSGKLDEVNSSVTGKLDNVNSSVSGKLDKVNSNVTGKLDDVNSSVTGKIESFNDSVTSNFKQIGEAMNSQTNTINKLISANSSKSEEKSKAIEDKLSSIDSKLSEVFQRVSKGKENMASTLLTYNVTVEPDASFEQFSTAIDELGKQKTGRDTVVSKAKANITADKILAGQTVEIDDLIIEGTATSDANASGGTMLSGSSAYVNGQKVYGEIPVRSMGNIVLTSANNTQHFEAGYYEAFTVTADAATLDGLIRFQIGHTHTGDENSGGGCYTTVDESRSWVCGEGVHLSKTTWFDGTGVEHHDKEGDCDKCGKHYRLGPDAPSYITCGRGETFYLRSCGHEEGDYIRDTDDISDVGENEKLLSATISMD